MGEFVRHEACKACGSSDGKAIYADGSYFCWVCKDVKPSQDHIDSSKDTPKVKKVTKKEIDLEIKPSTKPPITPERWAQIKEETEQTGGEYRNIRDDTYRKFGVRHKFSATDEVIEQYYPITKAGQLVGVKCREVPKDFFSEGQTGADCDLFMQHAFSRPGKYVVITEGEIDALSAYQMLNDYAKSKGHDYEFAVVSATTGANSYKQIAAQYRFLDKFDNIVISYDNDQAGRNAIEELVKILPKGKIKVMNMRYKDANEYLQKDQDKQFVNDFYDAEQYVPIGIVASNTISNDMRKELEIAKIPLPPFMHKLQDMMSGGIPLGRIINLGSASGTGKSTIVDEIIYYMLFNSPHMTGIVTLESTAGQYGIKLLSRHIGKKIELLSTEDAKKLLESDKVKEQENNLFNTENGTPRFYLVDDRDGDVENLQDAIENLIIGCGCKVVVLDPIHDIIAALPLEQQDEFMAWQKGMVKSHMVTFINVCHTRKTPNSSKAGSVGADLHEEDLMGSSALYKSAAANLMFTRNKEAEDEIEKNTTIMKATKIRWTGKTGIAGRYYYDNEKHRLYDLDDWLREHRNA